MKYTCQTCCQSEPCLLDTNESDLVPRYCPFERQQANWLIYNGTDNPFGQNMDELELSKLVYNIIEKNDLFVYHWDDIDRMMKQIIKSLEVRNGKA